MTVSIAVVCEAPADQWTGCGIADCVIIESVGWIEAEVIGSFREWRGHTASDSCLQWKNVRGIAQELGIKAHGHFDGIPGAPDAAAARRALLVLNASTAKPDAVVLLRDDDRQTSRREGLTQARSTTQPALEIPIVIGLAHVMRECWVLAGFVPIGGHESQEFQETRKDLGFNPAVHAERLSAKHESARRSSKRVLGSLVGQDRDREERCWIDTDISILEQNGRKTGLTDYIREIKDRLVPLFSTHR